ncbi:MAG: amidase family protein [Rhodospirillales bacterium]
MSDELCKLTACEAVDLLRSGEVTPLDLVDASAARIAALDGGLNAIPTTCIDRARDHAVRIMEKTSASGLLGGLPMGIKDLSPVAGVRTTWGSPIFADHVPVSSSCIVETVEAQGGIVMGKTNTPEFGAGGSTFNDVFGKTRNPWDSRKSVAGSSGGSAAAVASGMTFAALGSDLGGSLRIPASFNGIVGLRPSPGVCPLGPEEYAFSHLSVEGPMGRNAADVALVLDAIARRHGDDPLSVGNISGESYLSQVQNRRPPERIAFSADLGGIMPVDPVVREICRAAAEKFREAGVEVIEDCPDLAEAADCFQTLRAAWFVANMGPLIEAHRDKFKPEIIWNYEKGAALTADDIGRAERRRSAVFRRMQKFFRRCDLLVCPAVIVPPFDVDVRYVEEVAGVKFDNYIAWVTATSAISVSGCPAASAPAGFTDDGLPVGLQIIGPMHGDGRVLAAAAILDDLTGFSKLLPVTPHIRH